MAPKRKCRGRVGKKPATRMPSPTSNAQPILEESQAADPGVIPEHGPDDRTPQEEHVPQTLDELFGEYWDYCSFNHAHGVRDHPTLLEFTHEYYPTIVNGTDGLWVREEVLQTLGVGADEQDTGSAA